MGWIGCEGDLDFLTIVRGQLTGITQMVLDVPIKVSIVIVCLAFKFRKNLSVRFAQDVRQCGQATAVCHADDDFANSLGTSMLNHGIQGGNEGFPSFQRKPLLPDEFFLQELLEQGRLADLFEDLLPVGGFDARPVGQFNRLANPLLPIELPNVHVFDADAVTICGLKMGDDVPQFGRTNADLVARLECGVQVCFTQSKMTQ